MLKNLWAPSNVMLWYTQIGEKDVNFGSVNSVYVNLDNFQNSYILMNFALNGLAQWCTWTGEKLSE